MWESLSIPRHLVSSIAVSLIDGSLDDEFGGSRYTALDPSGRSDFMRVSRLLHIADRSISSEVVEFPLIDVLGRSSWAVSLNSSEESALRGGP
jgi:hypothetical protein